MAIEGENLGVATIYLTVDKSNMDATIGKAKLELAGMGAEASKQYDAMSVGQRKMAEGMVKQVEMLGKTRAEQIAYNAQLKIGGALGDEIAAKALANAQATTAAQQEATAATKAAADVQAEMAAAEDARFKQIARDAMAEVEARQAITAATMEQARANAALLESRGTVGALNSATNGGTLESTIVQQQIADYAALDAVMAKGNITREQVGEAEAALDRLQAAGMISNEELAETFAALDKATLSNTAELEANTVANIENAGAKKINSRTGYTISALFTDAASGQFSRSRREVAALANETGVLQKLMSPTGLAIGGVTLALIAFGKAVYDRNQDLLAFNKALGATGDFAGTTGLQLQGIASIVGATTGRYNDATKAVLALAQSGDVVGPRLQDMATVAVNMADMTGESIAKITKDLISLQGDPTQAIAKTTAAMGLLTTAQYNQIVMTQQQQGVQAAAALAMNDLAAASDSARAKLVANAGFVLRAWDGIKNEFSDIGRAIASIGAQTTIQTQIADITGKIKDLNHLIDSTSVQGEKNALQQRIQELQTQLAPLQKQQQGEDMFTAGQALANQGKQKHDQALAEALSSKTQGDEGFVAQAQTINEKRYAALVGIVDPSIIDRVNAAYDQQIRDAVKRANEQLPHGGRSGRHSDPAATALATFQSQVNGLTNKSIGVDGDAALTKYVQGVAKLNDEFDKAISKHVSLTQAQAAYDEGMKSLNATLAKNQAAQAADQKALRDASDAKVAAYKAQIALQVEAVGMGDKEIQRAQQLAQLRSQYADQIDRLRSQEARHPDQKAAVDIQIANVTREMNAMVSAAEQGYDQMDAAQSNWANGAAKAIKNFHDQTADVATQTAGIFNTAFSDMTNALMTFVETGKLSFKSLVTDILKGIAEMEIKAAESKLFDFVGGLISNYFGGGSTIDSGAISAGNYTGPHAMGGVFPGPISPFAMGGIVNSPTMFKFANGTGLMGEAGPEAIVPLSSDSAGRLGIKSMGGENIININTQVTVDSNGATSRTSSDSSDATARQLGAMMEAKAKEVMGRAIQPGGILWRHGVGQAA